MTPDRINPETGTPYSRQTLERAFRLVENPWNWKGRIYAHVEADRDQREVIRQAVIFFTGSVPTFRRISGYTYLVEAAGYYAVIGA